MAARKCKTGQRVTVAPNNRDGELRGGTFTVVRLLPEERGVGNTGSNPSRTDMSASDWRTILANPVCGV